MVGLIILAAVVVVGVVAFKLFKSGKAVTAGNVVSAVKADASAEAAAVEAKVVSAVANNVTGK